MSPKQIKTAIYMNEWALVSWTRATSMRTAARVVASCNPTAESSINVLRRCMRDNALDMVSRAKFSLKLQENK